MKEAENKLREVRSGTPQRPAADLPPVPVGLQQLLRLASVDPAFRARLLAQRDTTADAADIRLSPSERAILRAIPAEQLERMAVQLPPPRPEQTSRLRQIAANAVLLLGGAALLDGVACRKAEPTDTTRSLPDAAVSAEAEPVALPGTDSSADLPAETSAAADIPPTPPLDAVADAPADVPVPPTDARCGEGGSVDDAAAEPADEGSPSPDSLVERVVSVLPDSQTDLEENCRRQEERLMLTGGGAAPDVPDCYPPPRATVELAELSVEGPLAEEEVRRIIRRAASRLADVVRADAAGMEGLTTDPCEDLRYRRAYPACPPLAASEFAVVVEIGPDGRPRSLRVEGDAFGTGAKGGLLDAFRNLRFAEDQVPTRVRATWRIRPGGH